ncbi:lysylphosphatidylglycerol synthase transmembrane domain-containing protein [Syntrophomonas erecta]
MSNRLKFWLKLLVSMTLLVLILSQVNLSVIIKQVQGLPVFKLISVWGLSFLFLTIAAGRSCLLVAKRCRVNISLLQSYRFYLTGLFYNQLLPTSIGGDLVRIYMIDGFVGDLYGSSSTVFIERFSGLLATLMISLAAAGVLYYYLQVRVYINYVVVVLILAAIAGFLVMHPATRKVLQRSGPWVRVNRLKVIADRFLGTLQEYRYHPGLLMKTSFLSLCYQLSDILVAYLLGRMAGIELNFWYFLLFIPLVYVVTLIPISINGLGVRENTMVFLFAGAGVESSAALLLSLLIYLDRLLKGLAGGVWSAFQGRSRTITGGQNNDSRPIH